MDIATSNAMGKLDCDGAKNLIQTRLSPPRDSWLTMLVWNEPNNFVRIQLQILWSVSSSPRCDHVMILRVSMSEIRGWDIGLIPLWILMDLDLLGSLIQSSSSLIQYSSFKCNVYGENYIFYLQLDCWGPEWGTRPVAKVMRKEARHTQRRDRTSGVPLEILEHLPP